MPLHTPALHTSLPVRGLLSSQPVPLGLLTAAGQVVDEPVHVASEMQKSPDLAQTVPALPAGCVQAPPLHTSVVHTAPSSAHAVLAFALEQLP